jgi:hypothetical protein
MVSGGVKTMKRLCGAFLILFALTGGSAVAQEFIGGQYTCASNCIATAPGSFAYVTQNGWSLNLVNEIGIPSRAWIDRPGHFWAENWNVGALYSPDGNTIQFDNGVVWQRYVPPPPTEVIVRNRYIYVRHHHVVHHHVIHHYPPQ